MPAQTRKSDRRVRSKSPARKSRSRSRSRSRGRSKSPARTKAKASPSPSRRSPGRPSRAKSTEAKTPSTPTRVSARIAQKEHEKEQVKKAEDTTEIVSKDVFHLKEKEVKHTSTPASRFIHGIGGPLYATFAIFLLPCVVLTLNMACSKTSCSYQNLRKMPRDVGFFFNKEAFAVVACFLLLQAIVSILPVGKVVQGYPSSKGRALPYRCNGFFMLISALFPIAVASYLEMSFGFVLQHLIHYIVAGTVICFVSSVLLYIKARKAQTKDPADDGQTGCLPYDFFFGKELSPRVQSFDFKIFSLRSGVITWSVLNLIFVLESQASSGNMNLPLVAVAASQIFYVADLLWFEPAILGRLVITHEGTGFHMVFGLLVFLPFVYSFQTRFLMEHPQSWSYAAVAGFLVLFLIGYVIARGSNSQKDQFRRNPNDPTLAHLDTIPSPSGKNLLASGWWGLVRHPNYLGDLIMSVAWALPCGFNFLLPNMLPIFLLVVLVHRTYIDDELCRAKHGAAWDRYCQRVKYRIIPYVF